MRRPDLAVTRFMPRHVPAFLALAEREGWICDPWEFDFLHSSFPRRGHVACLDERPVAFVTSLEHERSGWIGNLLVHPELRGLGLGRMMLNRSLAALEEAGVETVWLTASEDGRRLYESVGFLALDAVIRWRATGVCGGGPCSADFTLERAIDLDRDGWGDRRDTLLRALVEKGSVLGDDDGFLLMQRTPHGTQLGPWSCRQACCAGPLLNTAWRHDPDTRQQVFLDSPGGNRDAGRILSCAGFTESGATVLMYRGATPAYRPAFIFALASMGSMG